MKVDRDKVNRELRRRFDEWCQSPCPLASFDGREVRCPDPRRATLWLWLHYNAPVYEDRVNEIWAILPEKVGAE